MPFFVISGLDQQGNPAQTIVEANSIEDIAQQGGAPILGITRYQVGPVPIQSLQDPRINEVSFVSAAVSEFMNAMLPDTPLQAQAPNIPAPAGQPDLFQLLREQGLGQVSNPGLGETIRPFTGDPVLGQLSSLFRTPTANTLRTGTPEGILGLQGAAGTIGITPSGLNQRVRAVTPGGGQTGSVLA